MLDMLYFLWFIKGAHYYIEHWQKCLLRELIPTNGVTEKIYSSAPYLSYAGAWSILIILLKVLWVFQIACIFLFETTIHCRQKFRKSYIVCYASLQFLVKKNLSLEIFFVSALIFHKIILYALNNRLRWNFHLKSMQVLFSWEFYWTISVKIMWGEVFFFTTNRRCVISEH